MSLVIKPARRKFHQSLSDVIDASGGYRVVAGMCLVTPVSSSKWKEDPLGSGQDIPVKHLQTILAAAGGSLTNLPLQNAVDELIQDHFLNLCHRRAYLEQEVFAVVEMLNGSKPRIAKEGT